MRPPRNHRLVAPFLPAPQCGPDKPEVFLLASSILNRREPAVSTLVKELA